MVVVPFATAVARPLFMPTLTTSGSEEYQTTLAPAPVTAPTGVPANGGKADRVADRRQGHRGRTDIEAGKIWPRRISENAAHGEKKEADNER